MQKKDVWKSVDRKTRKCLNKGAPRLRATSSRLPRSSNIFFALVMGGLTFTAIDKVHHSIPVETSLETKIYQGEMISENDIPVVRNAIELRKQALEKENKVRLENSLESIADRYHTSTELIRLVYDISLDERIDPKLIYSLIWEESRFNPNAIGNVGEIGLMQVRPNTARFIDPASTRKKLFDPAYNIRIGISHLKDQLHYYQGNKKLALLAYNRGRGTVNRHLSEGSDPANGYASRIMKNNM